MEIKLNFLLMGKTGHGKSRTGNSLLNRKAFKVSADTESKTKEVDYSFGRFGDEYALLVVDGPGLQDTDMNKARDKVEAAKLLAQDREAAAKHMDKALAMCYGGVDAFLFVTRFGCRFTKEDQNTLHDLKRIFGEDYINHIIVVMTGGDSFQDAMEVENDDEENDITFHDWCKKQKGELHQLYKDCNGRFVLFNNLEKDGEKMKAQIQEIVRLALDLQFTSGRYNSECFENARAEREKMILELKAPHLTIEIQEKLGLLSADIENFAKTKSASDKEKIEKGLEDLKKEIEIQDKDYGVLDHLKHLVEKVRRNLNNTDELQSLGKQIESARAAKGIWAGLGTVCTIAGGVIALAAPPVGIPVAVISALTCAIGFGAKQVEEYKSEEKKQEVEKRLKK